MKEDWVMIVILGVVGLTAVMFIGSGITGYLSSETCCTSLDCAEEKRCESFDQNSIYTSPIPFFLILAGIVIVIMGITYVIKFL